MRRFLRSQRDRVPKLNSLRTCVRSHCIRTYLAKRRVGCSYDVGRRRFRPRVPLTVRAASSTNGHGQLLHHGPSGAADPAGLLEARRRRGECARTARSPRAWNMLLVLFPYVEWQRERKKERKRCLFLMDDMLPYGKRRTRMLAQEQPVVLTCKRGSLRTKLGSDKAWSAELPLCIVKNNPKMLYSATNPEMSIVHDGGSKIGLRDDRSALGGQYPPS